MVKVLVMAPPTLDELEMWRHVSVGTAVVMYAKRSGLDVGIPEVRERIKAVFRGMIDIQQGDES